MFSGALLMKYWQKFLALFDIPSGTAIGLLTLAVVYSIFKGRDIGAGSAAAYATAIGAFATTNVMRPKS
jgi:hypothetical protein